MNKDRFTLRLLKPEDFGILRDIRLASLKTDPDSYSSTLAYESLYTEESFHQRILAASDYDLGLGYWGIFEQDLLAGYVLLTRQILPRRSHIAQLYELYVSPPYRRQKYATTLVKKCLEIVDTSTHLNLLLLSLNERNTAARTLYSGLGFNVYGNLPHAIYCEDRTYAQEIKMYYANLTSKE